MSKPLTLRPAIKKGKQVHEGKEGGSHMDIIKSRSLGIKAKDNEHGFVTPDGRYLDRAQALKWMEKNKPAEFKKLETKDIGELRSHDLVPRKSKKQRVLEEDL